MIIAYPWSGAAIETPPAPIRPTRKQRRMMARLMYRVAKRTGVKADKLFFRVGPKITPTEYVERGMKITDTVEKVPATNVYPIYGNGGELVEVLTVEPAVE